MNALDLIHKMFRPNEVMHPDPETLTTVVNPFNGATYVHFNGIEELNGEDNYQAWKGRGNAVKVHFWDEDGGKFALCFGFHKGNLWAWIENEENPFHD